MGDLTSPTTCRELGAPVDKPMNVFFAVLAFDIELLQSQLIESFLNVSVLSLLEQQMLKKEHSFFLFRRLCVIKFSIVPRSSLK